MTKKLELLAVYSGSYESAMAVPKQPTLYLCQIVLQQQLDSCPTSLRSGQKVQP